MKGGRPGRRMNSDGAVSSRQISSIQDANWVQRVDYCVYRDTFSSTTRYLPPHSNSPDDSQRETLRLDFLSKSTSRATYFPFLLE